MAEVQEFENVESGASLTYPAAAGSIRKGAHIVIKGRPCKVGFFSSTRLCLAWVFTFVQVPRCVPVYFIFLLLSLSLSLSLSLYLFIYLSLFASFFLFLSLYLSLSLYLFIYLSLSVSLSIYMFLSLSISV